MTLAVQGLMMMMINDDQQPMDSRVDRFNQC